MAASYPNAVKSFTAVNDGDTVADEMWEEAYDEITAMQSDLLTDGLSHNLIPDATAQARTLGSTTKGWGLAYLKALILKAATELTIATDAITATQGYHTVDTEADAATDNLATITAGSGVQEGAVLILRAENVARVVTVKDGTGNLLLNGDYALSATDRTLTLIYDGANWRELARSVVTLPSIALGDLPTVPACRVTHGSTQSVANSTDTALTFTAADVFDTDTMHEGVTNPTRITFITAGKYQVGANIAWASNGTGVRLIKLKLNGTTFIDTRQQPAANESEQGISTLYAFAANDYVEVFAYQNSGGALNVATAPIAWAQRVSA